MEDFSEERLFHASAMALQVANEATDAVPYFVCSYAFQALALQFERASPVTVEEAQTLRDHMLPSMRTLLDGLLEGSETGSLTNAMVKAFLGSQGFLSFALPGRPSARSAPPPR